MPNDAEPQVLRPREIGVFERLFLASIALAVLRAAVSGLEFQVAPGQEDIALVIGILTGTVLIALLIGLVLLISRRRSNIARWVLVLLTLIGAAGVAPDLLAMLAAAPLEGGLTLVQTLLQLIAVAQLFRPDARAWFKRA